MRLASPSAQTYEPIHTRESLLRHLSWALTLELSTIPPYLTAMYSLKDSTSPAYALVKDVALEEMLHLSLVCNLISSVGGQPLFGTDTVPEYPTYIPHHAVGGPFISLQALSQAVAATTFVGIEAPTDVRHPPPQGDDFQTIGQFYAAIEDGFEVLHKELGPDLFVPDSPQLDTRNYFGGGGGRLFQVRDLKSAKKAIEQIVEQGEGARPLRAGREGQPFGGRLHYGTRPDGTYGPILGVGVAPSHFERFTELADGSVPIGEVWPMRANLKASDIDDESLAQAATLFNQCWSLTLAYIQASYQQDPTLFYRGAVPLMHTALPGLARLLLQSPLDPRTGTLGPNAGPPFELEPLPSSPSVLGETAARLAAHPPADVGSSSAQSWASALESLVPFLQNLPAIEDQG